MSQGANRAVLDEALAGIEDRPSRRTVEMMMWARAIEGIGRFPRHFPAAEMITTPDARAASLEGVRRHLGSHPEDQVLLGRFEVPLDPDAALDDVAEFVESELRGRLADRAVMPRKRTQDVDRGDQIAVLAAAVGALTGAGLRPFLVSGTLLGHVRSG